MKDGSPAQYTEQVVYHETHGVNRKGKPAIISTTKHEIKRKTT